jgi:NADP-dependent 3-hydroxy acid dehydrogenase YdfG
MENKVVVVTGASSGIGAALAELVGRRGGRPVLAARTAERLAEVAGRIGGDALAVAADVTRRDDVERVRDAALERFGQIDVWVNNAGRGISRLVSELTDDDLDEMWRVNVKSAIYGVQAVLPHFRARGRGHIINVSSMLGRVPVVAIRSAYSAAKHALNALSINLRMELRAESPDLHVTTVLPGVVATEFGANARHGGPDSRALPGAQPVDEVAVVIADAIERPRAEVYTRPEMHAMVAGYYAAPDPAVLEGKPPFFVTPPGRR